MTPLEATIERGKAARRAQTAKLPIANDPDASPLWPMRRNEWLKMDKESRAVESDPVSGRRHRMAKYPWGTWTRVLLIDMPEVKDDDR